MIIFLYGPDTYRSRQKLNEIIERYKKIRKSGLSLKYYDFKEENFQDFKNEFQHTSMFEEKKLAVLNNVFSNIEAKEKFPEDGEIFQNSKNTVLLYERGKINKKDSLFIFLKKQGKSQEFEPLEGQRLKNWAKKEFAKYKCQIEENALEKLIEFVGNDLWRFSNEIKKLANFKSEINDKDIELLVKPKIETDIFKTIDFLAAKDKKKALELIKRHLEKGDHPLYLLSMINFQFRNLILIKASGLENQPYFDYPLALSKKLKIHPYTIKKTIPQAKKFTFEELKKIYRKIFQLDLDIKTGRIKPETAIDLLIAEI